MVAQGPETTPTVSAFGVTTRHGITAARITRPAVLEAGSGHAVHGLSVGEPITCWGRKLPDQTGS